MKVLLRRPVATQSMGSDGLTADEGNEESNQGSNEGDNGEGGGGGTGWKLGMERDVWDEPIIKRWQDAKVFFFMSSLFGQAVESLLLIAR